MAYWQLYYHVVWSTKNREPLITAAYDEVIQRSIRLNCQNQSALVHAIGVMPDHVHLAVSIPPRIAISDLLHRIKGGSSHLIRESQPFREFNWQPEFGIISFHEELLPKIVNYVLNQPQHHAENTIRPRFEIAARPYTPSQTTT